jgi:hypothetical protein
MKKQAELWMQYAEEDLQTIGALTTFCGTLSDLIFYR